MGQMTYAVMLGVKKAVPAKFEDGWWEVVDAYAKEKGDSIADGLRPATPAGDGDHDRVGIWIAVGASGRTGVPFLDSDFPIDGQGFGKEYKAQIKAARKAWQAFAEWCEGRKIKLGEPALWLVQTEVA